MGQDKKKNQGAEKVPATEKSGLSESEIAKVGVSDNQAGDSQTAATEQPDNGGKENAAAPPLLDNGSAGPVATVFLTKDHFDLLLTDPHDNAVDIVANADLHAIFIKNKIVTALLDGYTAATADPGHDGFCSAGTNMPPHSISESSLLLIKRLRDKAADTRAHLTDKKELPGDLAGKFRKYLTRLCSRLNVAAGERELVIGAGEIHSLVKYRHPSHNPLGFKLIFEAGTKWFRLLHEQPSTVRILRLLYRSLPPDNKEKPTAEETAANILTITDLYCETGYYEEYLTQERFQQISRELQNLTGKLFLKEVVEAFVAIMEEDVPKQEKRERSNYVVIYSDGPDRLYPLEARLKNEGFQITAVDSLESFVTSCRRRRPNVIIIRHHSLPRDIVKTLQYLSNRGINVSTIPVFLMVKGIFVDHMAPLLELGIEDIIDIDSNFDMLVLKIKKVRAELRASVKPIAETMTPQSGSRGNLSDMNLIDLLQALGPSQRTTRIRVKPEEPGTDELLMYLNQGNITYARLGNLQAEQAIYQALTWKKGTWSMEPTAVEDFPEPNNHLPNESILLEGCRLIDEGNRQPVPG